MTTFYRTLLSSLAIGVVALHGQSAAQSAGHDNKDIRFSSAVAAPRTVEVRNTLQYDNTGRVNETIGTTSIASDSIRRLEGIFSSYSHNPRTVEAQTSRAGLSIHRAEYILHVRVRLIDSTIDATTADFNQYRVVADVLDTLKGMATPAQIHFGYTPLNYFDASQLTRDRDDEAFPYEQTEPLFTTNEGRFTMKVGDEAIVFLRHDDAQENGTYNLNLDPWSSYNALAVVNGEVRDPNHIWSEKSVISYDVWKANYESMRRVLAAE